MNFLQVGLLSASFLRLPVAVKGAAGVLQELRLPVPQHIGADAVFGSDCVQLLLTLQDLNDQLGLVLRCVCSSCHGVVSFFAFLLYFTMFTIFFRAVV